MRILGITSNGGVKGCLSMPDSFIEGNIRDRRLRDIWDDAQTFSYNRRFDIETVTGVCRDCEFLRLCRTGCRSFTHTAIGKINENPYCIRASRA